jgi:hypothetical protein
MVALAPNFLCTVTVTESSFYQHLMKDSKLAKSLGLPEDLKEIASDSDRDRGLLPPGPMTTVPFRFLTFIKT